jgi:predicted DNA binding CopG/RHH family protein
MGTLVLTFVSFSTSTGTFRAARAAVQDLCHKLCHHSPEGVPPSPGRRARPRDEQAGAWHITAVSPERRALRRSGIFVVRREEYVYLVPFVEDERTVFLKTIIPSRKATKQYLGEESDVMKTDADEKDLLESVERGEWKSAGGGKRERTRYTRYAKATFRKDRRLNIRLSSKDLDAIQKRALAEGLPYQTLIASLLHKYAAGRLKEI